MIVKINNSNVIDKEKLLERSEELKQKIVSLNEQLTTQKMLIEGYESNQQIQLNGKKICYLKKLIQAI